MLVKRRSNVLRGLLKPWTTAAHALFLLLCPSFCIRSRPLVAERGKWCSNRKKERLEYFRGKTDRPDLRRTRNSISARQLRDLNFGDFLWQIYYLEAQNQSWLKFWFKTKDCYIDDDLHDMDTIYAGPQHIHYFSHWRSPQIKNSHAIIPPHLYPFSMSTSHFTMAKKSSLTFTPNPHTNTNSIILHAIQFFKL